jgi:hypothetical protein
MAMTGPQSPQDDDTEDSTVAHSGPLAEFTALRAEILLRDRNMLQLLIFQLTSASAIFAYVLGRTAASGLLLAIPLLSYITLGRFMAQRSAVSRAAKYITTKLNTKKLGLGWEQWLDENPPEDRIVTWVFPLLLAFPGVGALALALSFKPVLRTDGGTFFGYLGWIVGCLAVLASIYLVCTTHFQRERVGTRKTSPAAAPEAPAEQTTEISPDDM